MTVQGWRSRRAVSGVKVFEKNGVRIYGEGPFLVAGVGTPVFVGDLDRALKIAESR